MLAAETFRRLRQYLRTTAISATNLYRETARSNLTREMDGSSIAKRGAI